ncbi:MAG TPA: class I SAM-dependent methyltransferase [Ktedonobacteraceae bacterium]|nr:class I SAM-dependent methyltransferase [Ktedonobacteraceae bacterium]
MTVEEVYRYPDDYDLEVAARDIGDISFWTNLLRDERPERVLEIGCGTGRLTLPLAREGVELGFTVTGLDLEPAMLIRAEQRAEAEPASVREALRFVESDVRFWRTDERFDVVLMPYGIAHHLTCLEDRLAAWRGVHMLLKARGLFAVDVCAPDFSLLASSIHGTRRHVDLDIQGNDGRHLWRSVVTRYCPTTQQVMQDYEYDVTEADGSHHHYHSPFDMHVYYPCELKLLFQLTGFRLERLLGSYSGEPFGDRSPLILALARPA